MKFTHDQLPLLIRGIRPSDTNLENKIKIYYLNDFGKDILTIYYLGNDEWRFIADGRVSKNVYSTNFPIRTKERFIQEMYHIGFHVELK